jgi:hypothetical protein
MHGNLNVEVCHYISVNNLNAYVDFTCIKFNVNINLRKIFTPPTYFVNSGLKTIFAQNINVRIHIAYISLIPQQY